MQELKDLQLSDRDFDLLVDALDTLPEKGVAGELMGSLFGLMLAKDDPEAKEEFKREREQQAKERERKNQQMKDDVGILKGKLLMLKRHLLEQGALNETYGILNGK